MHRSLRLSITFERVIIEILLDFSSVQTLIVMIAFIT